MKLITARWDLSARGTGEVTYHRIGAGDGVWPSEIPGAVVLRREKGGTFRAAERHASDLVQLPDTLPLDTPVTKIVVRYRAGAKSGSSRVSTTLGAVIEGQGKCP